MAAAAGAALADASGTALFGGVMSGTSLDGIDVVLADFSAARPRVLAHVHRPFPAQLRGELRALTVAGAGEIERGGATAQRLGHFYADGIAAALAAAQRQAAQVAAVGVHGQTVRHCPADGYSIQLNAPALLAELTGIDIVADFRSRDIAAGGQGAPLVPAFHAAVFSGTEARAVVNIGGIANVTFLPSAGAAIGFDCGPGNVLLDAHAARHLGVEFDRNGEFAARGRVDDALLARCLAEPYLALDPPKSTGRELFSEAWLDRQLHGDMRPEDVQRTLTEFTARCIAAAVNRWCAPARELVVCGGGTRNATLMAALSAAVGPRAVRRSDELGIAAEQVEALAFAWLARCCLLRTPGNLPAVTGARGPRVLGAIYPR
jgi:anhydro-N-acetylmuramic acid kinase